MTLASKQDSLKSCLIHLAIWIKLWLPIGWGKEIVRSKEKWTFCVFNQHMEGSNTDLALNQSDLRTWLIQCCPFVFARCPEGFATAPIVALGTFALFPDSQADAGFSCRLLQVSAMIKDCFSLSGFPLHFPHFIY